MLAPLLLLCLPAAGLEDDLKAIAATLARPDSLKHEAERARAGLRAANAASTEFWKRVRKSDEPARLLAGPLSALAASLSMNSKAGPVQPLNFKARRSLERDGVKVQMVTFTSPTGLTVTANLYAPVKRPAKMPGLVIVHSHHNPKEQGELQDMGQLWAKAGCYVIVLDQLGHGERRQHPFATAKDYPTRFAVGRQDYYFRHNVAAQLQAAGESLVGWMIVDISAAVTALLEQPNIDRERIAVLGSVAGGGDPAAVAAALDKRIKAAVVFNFGGPQPETRFPLPPDADAAFNYAGGGSWETTRNLAYSARDGFLPWVIVAGVAPRRLVYAHEFSWDEKRDPVWKRLRELWAKQKQPGLVREAHGFGTLTGKGKDRGSHCNNIGAVHRKGIHAAFKQWWGVDAKEPSERKRWTTAELRCLGEKEQLPPARELARKLALRNAVPAEREDLKAHWAKLLHVVEFKADAKWIEKPITGAAVFSAGNEERDTRVTLFVPKREGKAPLTVLFGQGGAKELLAKRAADVAALIKKGEAVAVLDLGGTANLPPGNRGRTSSSTSVAASWLMLGKPLLGERLYQLRGELARLRLRKDIDGKKVRLWGDSTAPAYSGKADVVPLEHTQPPNAEPVGAHLAILAALFEEGIVEVRACGGLASWLSLLDGPAVHFPYDNVVPGAALADWPALCKALGPVPVRLERLVDGANRLVPLAEARKLYAGAKNVTVN